VIVLCAVLRIKRTLDGAEIDKIILGVAANKASAIEHRRLALWDRTVRNAAAYEAEPEFRLAAIKSPNPVPCPNAALSS
jgi:hypothetical protein